MNGSLIKKTLFNLSAVAAAMNGTVKKMTEIPLAALSAAMNGSLIKKTLFNLSAVAAAMNGTVKKMTEIPLAALSAAMNGSIVKKPLIALSAVVASMNGAISKKVLIPLAAKIAAFNGSIVKKPLIALAAAAAAFSGAISKRTSVPLSATSGAMSGGIGKQIRITVSAVFAAFSAAVSGTESGGGTTYHQALNAAVSAFSATLARLLITPTPSYIVTSTMLLLPFTQAIDMISDTNFPMPYRVGAASCAKLIISQSATYYGSVLQIDQAWMVSMVNRLIAGSSEFAQIWNSAPIISGT
jgi:hypothetical protein